MSSSKIHRRRDVSDKIWAKLESLLPGRKGAWDAQQKITGVLSTPFSGFLEQEPHGGIYPLTMVTERIRIDVSHAGVRKERGKTSWKLS